MLLKRRCDPLPLVLLGHGKCWLKYGELTSVTGLRRFVATRCKSRECCRPRASKGSEPALLAVGCTANWASHRAAKPSLTIWAASSREAANSGPFGMANGARSSTSLLRTARTWSRRGAEHIGCWHVPGRLFVFEERLSVHGFEIWPSDALRVP